MVIKYNFIGDNIIVNVPDNEYWELRFCFFDSESGADDYNLYLIYAGKKIMLRQTEYWTQGRPELPYTAVGELYENIVNAVANLLKNNPDLKFIDIDTIESELLDSKYEKLWLEKGFIHPNNDGSW